MCKLIVGINEQPKNDTFQRYIIAQQQELIQEKDGIGALVIDFDKKLHVFRELDDYSKVFQEVYKLLPNAHLVSIHSRTGTSGKRDIENVHFFKNEQNYFAHNGFVQEFHSSSYFSFERSFFQEKTHNPYSLYSDERIISNDNDCTGCFTSKRGICKKHERMVATLEDKKETPIFTVSKDDFCDSFQFLKNLPHTINETILEEEAQKRKFEGMGILYNENTKKVYLIAKKDIKLQTNKKDFGIFYSYSPKKEATILDSEKIYGIPIIKTTKIKVGLPIKTVFQGIYELKI